MNKIYKAIGFNDLGGGHSQDAFGVGEYDLGTHPNRTQKLVMPSQASLLSTGAQELVLLPPCKEVV